MTAYELYTCGRMSPWLASWKVLVCGLCRVVKEWLLPGSSLRSRLRSRYSIQVGTSTPCSAKEKGTAWEDVAFTNACTELHGQVQRGDYLDQSFRVSRSSYCTIVLDTLGISQLAWARTLCAHTPIPSIRLPAAPLLSLHAGVAGCGFGRVGHFCFLIPWSNNKRPNVTITSMLCGYPAYPAKRWC